LRVHELAKELGLPSKEIVARLQALGVEAKSHMSSVEDAAIELLREDIRGAGTPAGPEQAAPAPEPEAVPAPEPGAGSGSAPEAAPAPPPPAEPAAPAKQPQAAETESGLSVEGKVITTRGAVPVKDFADILGLHPAKLIAELMQLNVLASINQRIEIAIAQRIAQKHGFTLEQHKRGAEHKPLPRKREQEVVEKEDSPEDLLPRPPVVTFLGHVDHGKTSLMDRIRNTAVVSTESGGITQHVGAYTVASGGRTITFLDTPGHAAFTAMRARGADLTDIAVIVIAADDGIMPQTEEAIMHAQAAGVAMVIAINKTDLPAADVDRVKQQLQQRDMTPEDWGGETICCAVSAETGAGLDHLLEMLLLQADMLELKSNPARRASGYVIEAQLEPGMGPTANLLVTRGTLKIGDPILCGPHWGRVRALINDHGAKVKSVKPSTPVKCLGLAGVPEAGAAFRVCSNDRAARAAAAEAEQKKKARQIAPRRGVSLDDLYAQIEEGEKLQLNIVLKTDTQGSAEAILHALGEIKSDKVTLNTVLSGTGNITENDVLLASASDAVVLGFHVANSPGVGSLSKHEGVEIRLHSVIYELIDQVRDAMTGMLPPQIEERVTGVAEIKQLFPLSKGGGVVAGCLIASGTVGVKNRARVRRGDEVLYEGSIASLRHFQEEVTEIRQNQECGIRLDNFTAFAEGDTIEFYELEEVRQTL